MLSNHSRFKSFALTKDSNNGELPKYCKRGSETISVEVSLPKDTPKIPYGKT